MVILTFRKKIEIWYKLKIKIILGKEKIIFEIKNTWNCDIFD
jgi:hypothetical protein